MKIFIIIVFASSILTISSGKVVDLPIDLFLQLELFITFDASIPLARS